MTRMRESTWAAGLLCGVLFLLVTPLAAQSVPEQFTGRIVDAGGAVPGRSATFVTIRINEYTSDEDLAGYVDLLAEKGQDAVERELWNVDIGWIRIGNSLGYPLSIARSYDVEGGRIIRVLTDRPIQMYEVRRGLRSQNYPFGIIELKLDEEGKGEGSLIAAASAKMTDEALEIESFGTQPFRLLKMKTETPKEKKKKKEKK